MRGHLTPWVNRSFSQFCSSQPRAEPPSHLRPLPSSIAILRRSISSATLGPCVPSSTFRPRIFKKKRETTLGGHGLSVSTKTDTETNLNVDDLSAGRICEYSIRVFVYRAPFITNCVCRQVSEAASTVFELLAKDVVRMFKPWL